MFIRQQLKFCCIIWYLFKCLDLLRDGFGDHQYFHCLIPEYSTTDKIVPIGFIIYYFTYSTWKGRRVLHVDDLFVEPEHRSKPTDHVHAKVWSGRNQL